MYAHNYVRYLIEFHVTRDWFECHEIMEEMWKAESDERKRLLWLALVRIAVGLYHERRGNRSGALKMLRLVQDQAQSLSWSELGLDSGTLIPLIAQRVQHLSSAVECENHGKPFEVMNLPIMDIELLEQCKQQCAEESLEWQLEPPQWKDDLIHRHRLRDRSDVIEARKAALQLRQQ